MARPKSQLEKDYDTSETAKRCVGDLRLRRHGFRVKSRPKQGPTLWVCREDSGRWIEMTEQQAHALIDAKEKMLAEVEV